MNEDLFDRQLMDEVGELPPGAYDAELCTPWRAAVSKIQWGLALTTFKFEFFYLQYLLPLLGAVLLYLGCRSLRKENKWFSLCWGLSGFRLFWHMFCAVLNATPLMGALGKSALNWPLSVLINSTSLVLLFSFRAGVRAAFASTGEPKPKDWLGRGLIAYLTSVAIAVWSTLVPLTEPGFFGPDIIDEWEYLYYGRGIAFIALQIYLLVCIGRQSEALAGRGYGIAPVPVKVGAKALTVCVFGAVLLAIPPALWLGGRIQTGPVELPAPIVEAQVKTRDKLVELGLPEYLADDLDNEELARCSTALAVRHLYWGHPSDDPEDDTYREGVDLVERPLADSQTEMSVWAVELPGYQLRYYFWFRYTDLPALHQQEQLFIDPSSNYLTFDYTARLLWEQGGVTRTVYPEIQLAGGQVPDDLEDFLQAQMFPNSVQFELDRLGRIHQSPWFSFSIPSGAEDLRGYLSYTANIGEKFFTQDTFSDFAYVFLRHQSRLLHYPFRDISDLGGASFVSDYGPIQSIETVFYVTNK